MGIKKGTYKFSQKFPCFFPFTNSKNIPYYTNSNDSASESDRQPS